MNTLQIVMQRHGIPVTVTERGGTLELWLIQHGYDALAQDVLQNFKDNPPSPESLPTRRGASATRSLWQTLASQAGIVTFIVFVLVLLVYFMQWFIAPEATLHALLITPGGVPELHPSQPWRFVTPMLLHFSAMHLVFNLFWWWYLGGRLELTFGSGMLLTVTLVTAIVSNYAQWAYSGPLFGGLSGVVYGLFGFAIVNAWGRRYSALALPPALLVFMLGWLALGFTDLLMVNMANEAHLAGLLSGALIGGAVRVLKPNN
nr:rhomboid family intramembrane serine protease [Aliidiomarina indica]